VAVRLDCTEHDVRLTVIDDLAPSRVAAAATTGTVGGGTVRLACTNGCGC
jgi:hypothetical protein